jgi:hypothetical protein
VVQWLRDGLKIIREARETQPLAEAADPGAGLVLVPAFTGLGAPYWRPDCRGAVYGLTRNSGRPNWPGPRWKAWATRPATCSRRCAPTGGPPRTGVLRVDGGMTASDWTMQFLADILGAPVDRPAVTETTALGAAYLAGACRRASVAVPRNSPRLGAGPPLHPRNGPRHPRYEIRPLGPRRRRDDGGMTFAILQPPRILFGRGMKDRAADAAAFGARGLVVHGANPARADWLVAGIAHHWAAPG